jgi:hypothetical protein
MRAISRVLFALFAAAFLVGCANSRPALQPDQSYALAPDLSVRVVSSRPSLSQLQLQITLLATGNTPVTTLVPDVVVIPSGGRETSSTLDFKQADALITMLLADAQKVASVTVRDTRSGNSMDWAVQSVVSLLPCKSSNDCELIGLPHAQSLPERP